MIKEYRIVFMGMMLLLNFVAIGYPSVTTHLPPVKGEVLPPFKLSVPKGLEERNYLGVSGKGTFRIPKVKARVVVIEIFNLYCPVCVKMAPVKKELYRKIENNPDLKGKIKFIGIGAGNTLKEVETYKNITETPFPLFPDKEFAIHSALGEVRTPYFIVIKINDDGSHEVIYSELGKFNGTQDFLESVTSASGLKETSNKKD